MTKGTPVPGAFGVGDTVLTLRAFQEIPIRCKCEVLSFERKGSGRTAYYLYRIQSRGLKQAWAREDDLCPAPNSETEPSRNTAYHLYQTKFKRLIRGTTKKLRLRSLILD